MSIKEISEAIAKENVIFGLKETLKFLKKSKNKKARVFITNDAREETINKLEAHKLELSKIKGKEDTSKELGLNFECEVFLIK